MLINQSSQNTFLSFFGPENDALETNQSDGHLDLISRLHWKTKNGKAIKQELLKSPFEPPLIYPKLL